MTIADPARLDSETANMIDLSVTAYDSPNTPSARMYDTVPVRMPGLMDHIGSDQLTYSWEGALLRCLT